jgi:antitoxin HicB
MMIDYPFSVRKLSSDEGTGYLAEALDLNGCIADGETVEEAIYNLEDAITSWIKTAQELGKPIPLPSSESYSGKWVIRTPKSLHRKLTELSRIEGVSLNTLTVSLLAERVGTRLSHLENVKQSSLSHPR